MCVYIDDGFGPSSPLPSLDLARKKQNSLKLFWLAMALLSILKSQFGNHKKNLSGW